MAKQSFFKQQKHAKGSLELPEVTKTWGLSQIKGARGNGVFGWRKVVRGHACHSCIFSHFFPYVDLLSSRVPLAFQRFFCFTRIDLPKVLKFDVDEILKNVKAAKAIVCFTCSEESGFGVHFFPGCKKAYIKYIFIFVTNNTYIHILHALANLLWWWHLLYIVLLCFQLSPFSRMMFILMMEITR